VKQFARNNRKKVGTNPTFLQQILLLINHNKNTNNKNLKNTKKIK
jgi:hypothetical protein